MVFSPEARAQVVQRSVDLLSSCGYTEPNPKWGAPGQPQSMANAEKESHLRLVFSNPHKVEVPDEKTTVQVREMVISLPLTTGGIWVRSVDGVAYFAMFSHSTAEALQALLKKAQPYSWASSHQFPAGESKSRIFPARGVSH